MKKNIKMQVKNYIAVAITAAVMMTSGPGAAWGAEVVFEDAAAESAVSESGMGDPFFAGTPEFSQETSPEELTAPESPEDPFGDDSETELFIDEETKEVTEKLPEDEQLLAGELATGSINHAAVSAAGVTDNRNGQHYRSMSSPVQSYLTAKDSGYMRVEYVGSQMLIENYNTAFQLVSQKYIGTELEYFGGFYEGSNAYFLVFGQDNWEENDEKEVIRVVKYDKNWKRLGSASLKGANTTQPFSAGSLRMAESSGYLYIRTCHTMYTSKNDGLNHQANLTMQVRLSDMTVMAAFYAVSNIADGYVSHSFNQFILVDDQGNIVALDHGDAYPRSAALGIYEKMAGESSFCGNYYADNIFPFQGNTGANYTGASLGGLEYSASSYLTAFSSVNQDEGWANYTTNNIYVTATPRSDCTKTPVRTEVGDGWYSVAYPLTVNKTTAVRRITNYAEGEISASTPHLVKVGPDSFLLMWAQMEEYYESNGKISYVFLDGNGNVTSDVYTKNGYLSDCKPVVSGGTASWYVTDGEKLTFCQIKQDGSYKTEVGHIHTYEPEMKFVSAEMNCGLIEGTVQNPLTTNTDGAIKYSTSDSGIASVNSSGKVTLKGLGTCTITASAAAGVNYAAKKVSYVLHVLDLKKQIISVPGSFTRTYGDKDFSLKASCLGGAALSYSSGNKKVLTVSDQGTVTIVGAGTAVITVRAKATSKYAAGLAKVTVTINKKSIADCRLVFTQIGSMPFASSEFGKYLAVTDEDKVLKANVDYQFWGGSWQGSGDTLFSASEYVEGLGNYTGMEILTVSPISQKSVLYNASCTSKGNKLTWAREGGAMGYYIYRKQAGGKYKIAKKITDKETTTWTDTVAAEKKAVCSYYIKAYTKSGNTVRYASASKSIQVIPAPTLKTVTSAGYNKLKITWESVEGADGYVLYQKIGKTWKRLKITRGTSYTHTNSASFPIKTGAANTYTVKAYQTVSGKPVYGSFSKTGISGKAVPGRTSVTSVTKYGKSMKVTFKAVSGATGYEIYRQSGTKWVKIASTGKRSYTDKKAVKKGQFYRYRVRAYRTVGTKKVYGSYSASKSGTR